MGACIVYVFPLTGFWCWRYTNLNFTSCKKKMKKKKKKKPGEMNSIKLYCFDANYSKNLENWIYLQIYIEVTGIMVNAGWVYLQSNGKYI